MRLQQYLLLLDNASRDKLALACGTTYGNLRNAAYDDARRLNPAVCAAIERETRQSVCREELRHDWASIWPELTSLQRRCVLRGRGYPMRDAKAAAWLRSITACAVECTEP